MKRKILPGALAAALSLSAPALAFHSGGVGPCMSCHDTRNGQSSSPSSACLSCHQGSAGAKTGGIFVATPDADMPAGKPPVQLTPGGDFGWLKKNYAWIPAAGMPQEFSRGERKGHNIISPEYGYLADSRHHAAPGGTYASADLHCSSCHDPHGKFRRNADGSVTTTGSPIKGSGSYAGSEDPTAWGAVGTYRLLAGTGYSPKSLRGAHTFAETAPAAVSPDEYNRAEGVTQTRVAYGDGMSEWCGNCHAGIHGAGENLAHPAGVQLTQAVIDNYNRYVKSGDVSRGDNNSYSSLVPFEEGSRDYTALKAHARSDDSYLSGPSFGAKISCLSCHRAHASGFDGMLRYGYQSEFMTVADAAGNAIWPDPAVNPAQAQGRTVAEQQQAYYGRPAGEFAANQRVLCNKCHAKD